MWTIRSNRSDSSSGFRWRVGVPLQSQPRPFPQAPGGRLRPVGQQVEQAVGPRQAAHAQHEATGIDLVKPPGDDLHAVHDRYVHSARGRQALVDRAGDGVVPRPHRGGEEQQAFALAGDGRLGHGLSDVRILSATRLRRVAANSLVEPATGCFIDHAKSNSSLPGVLHRAKRQRPGPSGQGTPRTYFSAAGAATGELARRARAARYSSARGFQGLIPAAWTARK